MTEKRRQELFRDADPPEEGSRVGVFGVFLGTICLLAVGWICVSLVELRKDLALMQSSASAPELEQIRKELAELRQAARENAERTGHEIQAVKRALSGGWHEHSADALEAMSFFAAKSEEERRDLIASRQDRPKPALPEGDAPAEADATVESPAGENSTPAVPTERDSTVEVPAEGDSTAKAPAEEISTLPVPTEVEPPVEVPGEADSVAAEPAEAAVNSESPVQADPPSSGEVVSFTEIVPTPVPEPAPVAPSVPEASGVEETAIPEEPLIVEADSELESEPEADIKTAGEDGHGETVAPEVQSTSAPEEIEDAEDSEVTSVDETARAPALREYTIKPGDSLSKIASKHAVSTASLAKANGITNPNRIRVGAVLKIPAE